VGKKGDDRRWNGFSAEKGSSCLRNPHQVRSVFFSVEWLEKASIGIYPGRAKEKVKAESIDEKHPKGRSQGKRYVES